VPAGGNEGPPAPSPPSRRSRPPNPASRGPATSLHIGELARVPHAATRRNAEARHRDPPDERRRRKATPSRCFLRGFDAREGQDIEFSVEDAHQRKRQPSRNGLADTHFIIPEPWTRSGRRGPSTRARGTMRSRAAPTTIWVSRNAAHRQVPGWQLRERQRLLLLFGPSGATRRTFGAGEIYATDGFGQNRDARRATAMGQYEGRLSAAGCTGSPPWPMQRATTAPASSATTTFVRRASVFTTATTSSARRVSKFAKGRRLSVLAIQRRRHHGRRRRPLATGFLDLPRHAPARRLHRLSCSIRRSPRSASNEQRGDMLDIDQTSLTLGARGSGRLHGTCWDKKQELEFGYFAKGDQVSAEQQRLQAGKRRSLRHRDEPRLEARRHRHLRRREPAGHAVAQLCAAVSDRMSLHSNVDDLLRGPRRVAPLEDQPSRRRQLSRSTTVRPSSRTETSVPRPPARPLPRGTLALGPVQNFTFSASYGKGVRSIDPGYITQDINTPFASIDAYEGGVSYAGQVGDVALVARSIFFRTHVDRDLIFNESAGRNVLGPERREPHGWAQRGSPIVPRRGGEPHARSSRRNERHPPARRLRARRRLPLGHGRLQRSADHAFDAQGSRDIELRHHVRGGDGRCPSASEARTC